MRQTDTRAIGAGGIFQHGKTVKNLVITAVRQGRIIRLYQLDAVTVFMTMYWLRVNPDYVKSELETGFATK